MRLGQDIPLNSDYLAESQPEGETSPCEQVQTGEVGSFIDKAVAWAKANKSWLPWALAAGTGVMLLRKRK